METAHPDDCKGRSSEAGPSNAGAFPDDLHPEAMPPPPYLEELPPAPSVFSLRRYSRSRHLALEQEQCSELEEAMGPDMIHYHVMKPLFSRDTSIHVGEDKLPQYHLIVGQAAFGEWSGQFCRGAEDGIAPIMNLSRERYSPSYQIQFPNGSTTLERTSGLSKSLEFKGTDQKTYEWRNGNSHYKRICIDLATQRVVALKRDSTSLRKSGVVLVNSLYKGQAELVLATALASDERL